MVFKTTCVGSIPATLVIVNILQPNQNVKLIKAKKPAVNRTLAVGTPSLYGTKRKTARRTKLFPFIRLKKHFVFNKTNPVTLSRRRKLLRRYSTNRRTRKKLFLMQTSQAQEYNPYKTKVRTNNITYKRKKLRYVYFKHKKLKQTLISRQLNRNRRRLLKALQLFTKRARVYNTRFHKKSRRLNLITRKPHPRNLAQLRPLRRPSLYKLLGKGTTYSTTAKLDLSTPAVQHSNLVNQHTNTLNFTAQPLTAPRQRKNLPIRLKRASRKSVHLTKQLKSTTNSYAFAKGLVDKLETNVTAKLLKRSRHSSRKARAILYSANSSMKKPSSTQSYNLTYEEQFSLRFSKTQPVSKLDRATLPYDLYSLNIHQQLHPYLIDVLSTFPLDANTQNFMGYVHYTKVTKLLPNTPSNQAVTSHNLASNLTKALYINQVNNLLSHNKRCSLQLPTKVTHETALNPAGFLIDVASTKTAGSSKTLLLSKVAQNWSLEMDFVNRRNLNAPNAVFILAKAPTYRMRRDSESPISTSQHHGNFFNMYTNLPRASTRIPALFHKSRIISPLTTLSGFKKGGWSSYTLNKLFNKLQSSTRKKHSSAYANLLYTNPVLGIIINSAVTEAQDTRTLIKLCNLRQITTFKRRAKSRSRKNRPGPLRKQKFVSKHNLLTLRTKRKFHRILRRGLRRTNRFSRWKTRKATFYFSKFLRINKRRKNFVKIFTKTNYVHNSQAKYNSFMSKSQRHVYNVLDSAKAGTIDRPSRQTNTLNYNSVFGSDHSSFMTHAQSTWLILWNPILLKSLMFTLSNSKSHKTFALSLSTKLDNLTCTNGVIYTTNLTPHKSFNKQFSKKVLNSFANRLFREDLIPLYQNTLIRFIEFCTGKKAMFQFYPFVNQHVEKDYMVRYKKWLPRMSFYERRLGHRFFLEESLHIMHLSFSLRDPKIIASWLRAIILRISFWKTRSIFRFLKYLFHNYFIHVFDDIRIKGLKIRLKGKISAAGNSRKRTILYRVGKTSHSEVNLRVVKDFSLINTFTGVMGFQVYLFY